MQPTGGKRTSETCAYSFKNVTITIRPIIARHFWAAYTLMAAKIKPHSPYSCTHTHISPQMHDSHGARKTFKLTLCVCCAFDVLKKIGKVATIVKRPYAHQTDKQTPLLSTYTHRRHIDLPICPPLVAFVLAVHVCVIHLYTLAYIHAHAGMFWERTCGFFVLPRLQFFIVNRKLDAFYCGNVTFGSF